MIRKQETRTRLLRIIIDSGAWIFTGWGGVKSLRGFASGTAAPSCVKIREIVRVGVQSPGCTHKIYTGQRTRRRKRPDENRLKSGRDEYFGPRNEHWKHLVKAVMDDKSTAAFSRYVRAEFRGHAGVSWTGGVMEREFDSQDLSEFIAACAKCFCPECGKPVMQNKTGRPRSFCSDRCRWAFNKRSQRRKAKEEILHENSRAESPAGDESEAGRIQSKEKAEAGR
jgi:predicted nucleic acid-binding Zn ribbon protein